MLHACFSKCDGFSKPKNGIWRLENQPKSSSKGFKIHPKSRSKPIMVQRTSPKLSFFDFSEFLMDFWSPKWNQNRKKSHKNRCRKKTYFWMLDVRSNFLWFGVQKWIQNHWFFNLFSTTSILQKSCSRRGGSSIFRVWSLQKSNKNRCKNVFKKNLLKKGLKIEFWRPFWRPKTLKIAPQSDAKRSLFCDAMQITRKSSETNGACDFWTAKMALHMIRSTLSIYLFIYWSASRRPNHQSKSFNLKCFTRVFPLYIYISIYLLICFSSP